MEETKIKKAKDMKSSEIIDELSEDLSDERFDELDNELSNRYPFRYWNENYEEMEKQGGELLEDIKKLKSHSHHDGKVVVGI